MRKACASILRQFPSVSQAESPVFTTSQQQQNAAVVQEIRTNHAIRCLEVKWDNGLQGTFPYAWLRDNAPSQHTYNFGKRNRARHLLMNDLDTKITPAKAEVSSNGNGVSIAWDKEGKITSEYPNQWLMKRNPSDPTFHQRRRNYHHGTDASEHWGSEKISGILQPGADWDRMMDEPRYLRDQLVRFMTYGILHIRNAPPKTRALNELGETLGYLLNGHHGIDNQNSSVFQVFVELDPCNLMNTPKDLGLHTDFPQYQTPPEVQILHVVEQAGKGGESQFCDGFHVAEQLRVERPDIFKTLSTYPIEYIDWGEYNYAYEFAAKWKVIELDQEEKPKAIFFNNAVRSWYYEAPVDEIPKIYDALKVFNDYCYQARNLLNIKLDRGEMMMFANNRVMHGRSAFELDSTKPTTRHLEGAFVNFDVIRSKIRVINETLNEIKHAAYEI